MKKLVSLILIALLALSAVAALADTVTTTGNVNLRSGPGKQYDIVTDIGSGRTLDFLGDISTDERGVDWYHVSINGKTGWVSSKYAVLQQGGSARSSAPAKSGTAKASGTDLSNYYWKDLGSSAAALGLNNFRQVESEAPMQYSGNGATISGYDLVEDIVVTSSGYTVLGAAVGMTMDEARNALSAAGLNVDYGSDSYFSAEFPANNSRLRAIDNFGGCVNVDGSNGRVTRINMTSYTDW